MNEILEKIQKLYTEKYGKFDKIELLRQSGSYRKYFRFFSEQKTVLGVYNPDRKENEAFVSFAKHFKKIGLNVPDVFDVFFDENIYFIEDLGDETLFDFLQKNKNEKEIIKTYKKILDWLIRFQFEGIKNLDLTKCYPRDIFDKQSIMWDLNYFKYFVLKIAKVTFDEQALENDFQKLADFLTSTSLDYFLYRDFQSKNILLKDDDVYFIDFQGGRKGAIFYDVASLLYDSKAKLPESIKNELLEYYYSLVNQRIALSEQEFYEYYYYYVLIRVLQAFGAYGFRGIVERKLHFIASIPQAIENIKKILTNEYLTLDLPELTKALKNLTENSQFVEDFTEISGVKIRINSFSFLQNGYPRDEKKHGGGFVFDCRFLPNPGRYSSYKKLSGLDKDVIDWLEAHREVENFVVQAVEMIRNAAKAYQNRGFTDLQVNFGCTGGQHRSVYCAEKVSEILRNFYNCDVEIKHLNLNLQRRF